MGKAASQFSVHGKRLYQDQDDKTISKGGFVAGGEQSVGNRGGDIVFPAPDRVAIYDDFLGPGLDTFKWAYVEQDTGAAMTGVVTTATGGVFRMTSSAAAQPGITNVRTECQALTTGAFKNFKANMGKAGTYGRVGLRARVKFQSVSRTANRTHAFVGFSDSGGAETPILDTGAGLVAQAGDLMGIAKSPGGDTGYVGVAVQGGTIQHVVLGVSPTANVYDVLETVYERDAGDTGGTVTFYVNGIAKGSISNPITSSVALSPWMGFAQQDTGPRFMDIDDANPYGPRDTGT